MAGLRGLLRFLRHAVVVATIIIDSDLADVWAKAGADLSAPPDWALAQLKQELKANECRLEYMGLFRKAKRDEPRPRQPSTSAPWAASPKTAPRQPHVLGAWLGCHKCVNYGM
eukprot:9386539-Pyramimonas_sp.AAC.1